MRGSQEAYSFGQKVEYLFDHCRPSRHLRTRLLSVIKKLRKAQIHSFVNDLIHTN